MSDITGVVASNVEDISLNYITNANNLSQQLSEIAAAISDTGSCFECPEANAFRNDFDAYNSTSHNIPENVRRYSQDLLLINESFDVLDHKMSTSTTDNIKNVEDLAERRII